MNKHDAFNLIGEKIYTYDLYVEYCKGGACYDRGAREYIIYAVGEFALLANEYEHEEGKSFACSWSDVYYYSDFGKKWFTSEEERDKAVEKEIERIESEDE